MSSPIDTEDWSLHAFLDWTKTKERVPCDGCSGSGKVGGGFKDMEGPRECTTCYGTGSMHFTPKTKKPEIPKELKEHLRNAWVAYWNVDSLLKKDNE